MSEKSGILSSENQPTIIVVVFVLTTLSIVMGVYNTLQVNDAFAASSLIDLVINERLDENTKKTSERIDALEARLAEAEKRGPRAEAAAAEGAAPAEGAEAAGEGEGKAGKGKKGG
jgi:hypothetical protein